MTSLEGMAEVATLLDEWCEFCGERLASIESADGVKACAECAEQVLAALAKYEAEGREVAAIQLSGPKVGYGSRNPRLARHAKARAKRRAKRKRTKR